jgi:4-amino-4-deoxy-L-arabinose transferase-like glycosyltransferase/membrane-associated phospholipid phosphatase
LKTSGNGKAATVVISGAIVFLASFALDSIAGKAPQATLATFIFKIFNFLGNGSFLFALCAAVWLIGIALKKDRLRLAFLDAFFSAAASGIFVQILKTAIERPRPSLIGAKGLTLKLLENPSLLDFTGKFNSMPSGHTTISFAVAYALGRHSPRFKPLLYLTAVLVGVARVYLGSHYPSDVVAGALLGLFIGWLAANPLKDKKRWLFAGLVILTVAISFFKSGGFIRFDVDEAVFSEATREMVETGNYITPTYNYEPRYDKPILFYWLMSASYKLGGVSEASARAVSGAFGALLVIMTFFFLRRVRDDKTAFLGAIALLLNIEYFVYSHSAVTDMTLAFFITASLFSFYIGLESDEKKWPLAFWAASALAVLTKGAIGLLFPLAISFLYLLASGRLKDAKKFLKPLHVALFFIIAAPWFAAETYVNGWDFINAFVIKHHFKRYTEVISSHGGPPYYYLGVLAVAFFPWVAFVPQALWKGLAEYREKTGGLYLFSAIWFIFVLVFFTISSTKLPNYIFPLMPASAILAGLFLYDLVKKERANERLKGLYVVLALSAVFSIALFILPSISIKSEVALPPSVFYACATAFLAVFLFFLASLKRPVPAIAGVSASMIALLVVLRLYAVPPLNAHMQQDLYLLASSARTSIDGAENAVIIASYEINRPSLAFYAGSRIVKIEKSNACDIKELAKRGRLFVITQVSKLHELKEFD